MPCYNPRVMVAMSGVTRWLHIALGLSLLIWIYPAPGMFSRQAGHMGMMSGANTSYGHAAAADGLPVPCCDDTMGALSLTCGILEPQRASAVLMGGAQQIVRSPLSIHVIFGERTTPPPKA